MKKRIIALASSLLFVILGLGSTASAAPASDAISLYFSAPFVTGSHVATGANTEDFNSYTGDVDTNTPCPTSNSFSTITFTAGSCTINQKLATSAGASTQAIGVPYSNYVSKTLSTTFTFNNPVKYVGFWWMMGSNGNNVDFLDSNGVKVASLNVNDIITFFGSNTLVTNADTRTVNTVGGGTHLKKLYYRGPASYTGTVAAPVMDYNVDSYANEPWVYLNLFVSGSLDVKKVNFSGSNFEMDNLTVSTVEQTPQGDMVLVKSLILDQIISWGPTNTSISEGTGTLVPDQLASLVTPSSGGGAITYSVVSAGTSGCTVDRNTGVITYTAIGNCKIRATAAAVSGKYNLAATDTIFAFTAVPTQPAATPSPTTTTTTSPTATPSAQPVVALASTGSQTQSHGLAAVALFGIGLGFIALSSRKLIKR